jgi:hypothetical protein
VRLTSHLCPGNLLQVGETFEMVQLDFDRHGCMGNPRSCSGHLHPRMQYEICDLETVIS